jgi:hypothetical protein
MPGEAQLIWGVHRGSRGEFWGNGSASFALRRFSTPCVVSAGLAGDDLDTHPDPYGNFKSRSPELGYSGGG